MEKRFILIRVLLYTCLYYFEDLEGYLGLAQVITGKGPNNFNIVLYLVERQNS